MNRREFITASGAAGLGLLSAGSLINSRAADGPGAAESENYKLLPFPQDLIGTKGSLRLGKPEFISAGSASRTKEMAKDSLRRFLGNRGRSIPVRLGSVEEGYDKSWIGLDENEFLLSRNTSDEASILHIRPREITVVGNGKWGMLYGVQTVNQLIIEARRKGENSIPCMTIRDWPDMRWRCLSPTLTWYSGGIGWRDMISAIGRKGNGNGWRIGRRCISATGGLFDVWLLAVQVAWIREGNTGSRFALV